MPSADRLAWDATTMLEALGAADAALWVWTPEKDRLRLSGASRVLGLGPLAPEANSAALRALVLPQDRAAAEEMLRVRAAGVVAKELRFAASERDPLTGLLDRRSFLQRARERLSQPGPFELVVGDLNRLRRLNEALGHERADLVLAALGSRLAAAFPEDAVVARIGEDEFAVLARR